MRLTSEDVSILYAALLTVLHGDEDLWEELTSDDMDRANSLFARLEARANRNEEDEDDDDDDYIDIVDDDVDDYEN